MPDVTGKGYKCNVHDGFMQPNGELRAACTTDAETETDGTEVDTATTLLPVEDLYGLAAIGKKDTDASGKIIPRGRPRLLNRKAVVGVRVCGHHHNWPFSEDAKRFAKTPAYESQQAQIAERKTKEGA